MDHVARRIRREQSQLLVIDVQERLLPHIADQATVLDRCCRIVSAARILGVPISVTEQYRRGLGPTVAPLASVLGPAEAVEKLAFSCCGAEGLTAELASRGRPQIVVVGIEAHVCVEQTVLDLLSGGSMVYVCADAVSSRRPHDREVSLARVRQAGAVVTTTEAVMFQWLERAGTDEFKQVAKLVKEL